jgi:hypothetical protein
MQTRLKAPTPEGRASERESAAPAKMTAAPIAPTRPRRPWRAWRGRPPPQAVAFQKRRQRLFARKLGCGFGFEVSAGEYDSERFRPASNFPTPNRRMAARAVTITIYIRRVAPHCAFQIVGLGGGCAKPITCPLGLKLRRYAPAQSLI